MEYLYDITPLYIREEQYDTTNPELKEMSIEQILKEIDRTNKEIGTWQMQIDKKLDTDRYPIYIVKERLKNANVYNDQLHSYLTNHFPPEEIKDAIKKHEEAKKEKEKKDKDEYVDD